MTKVAIIPARGGSTRVPLKNIREFHGIPMLSRTVSVLKDSGCFDRIVISIRQWLRKRLGKPFLDEWKRG